MSIVKNRESHYATVLDMYYLFLRRITVQKNSNLFLLAQCPFSFISSKPSSNQRFSPKQDKSNQDYCPVETNP